MKLAGPGGVTVAKGIMFSVAVSGGWVEFCEMKKKKKEYESSRGGCGLSNFFCPASSAAIKPRGEKRP